MEADGIISRPYLSMALTSRAIQMSITQVALGVAIGSLIEGVLPTAAAVSDLGATTVLFTIAGFAAIYTVLFIVEVTLMLAAIRKGPDEDHEPEQKLLPEALEPAE